MVGGEPGSGKGVIPVRVSHDVMNNATDSGTDGSGSGDGDGDGETDTALLIALVTVAAVILIAIPVWVACRSKACLLRQCFSK